MSRYLCCLLLLVPIVGCGKSKSGAPVMSIPSAASNDGQSGPVRVYFTRPGSSPEDPNNIAKILVGYINQAQKTIDVCAFELDNKVITDALVKAVGRGVRVRLVTETNYLNESGVKALKQVGVGVVDDQRDGALMHDKFMVFDNKTVWTGSMNFTENCAYKNNNHGIFFDDARLAANYATKFTWMFEQHKFGGLPDRNAKIPNPIVTLSDGTVVENYFSTHDHIASHLIDHIGKSKQSIRFLAFSYTHQGICDAMTGRAKTGIPVQGVFEKSQATNKFTKYHNLHAFGSPVEVYLDANPRNMHHKVIILDQETTVAGSYNFSDSAEKSNDENVVIIRNKDVARRFEEEFQKVFGEAKIGRMSTSR